MDGELSVHSVHAGCSMDGAAAFNRNESIITKGNAVSAHGDGLVVVEELSLVSDCP
jgi:hypothetical protein